MTDIEELLRESLRTAPAVVPSSSDPVATVSGRVRRARALWGGGVVAVVAMLVAAIVVPLSMRDSSSGRLVPSNPSASATPSADRTGLTVWARDAVAVTAGGGWLWEVARDSTASDGSGYVVKVDPATHRQVQKWDVAAPFEFVSFGLDSVWVWGGGDGGYPDGRLQVLDPAAGDVTAWANPGHGFGGVAVADGHAWVNAGSNIWEFDAGGRHKLADVSLGAGVEPGAIYAVAGKLLTQTSSTSMQYVIPNPDGEGARLGDGQAVMDATEQLLGTEEPDVLLVSTGGVVERWPVRGDGAGDHALLNAPVFAVAVLPNRDLLVATGETDSTRPALWIALTSAPDGKLCETCVRKIADNVEVLSVVANPRGGADFVLSDGTAEHWAP
jgi:hypothetical protein